MKLLTFLLICNFTVISAQRIFSPDGKIGLEVTVGQKIAYGGYVLWLKKVH